MESPEDKKRKTFLRFMLAKKSVISKIDKMLEELDEGLTSEINKIELIVNEK